MQQAGSGTQVQPHHSSCSYWTTSLYVSTNTELPHPFYVSLSPAGQNAETLRKQNDILVLWYERTERTGNAEGKLYSRRYHSSSHFGESFPQCWSHRQGSCSPQLPALLQCWAGPNAHLDNAVTSVWAPVLPQHPGIWDTKGDAVSTTLQPIT